MADDDLRHEVTRLLQAVESTNVAVARLSERHESHVREDAKLHAHHEVLERQVHKLEIDLAGTPAKVAEQEQRLRRLEETRAQLLVLAAAGSAVGTAAITYVMKLLGK